MPAPKAQILLFAVSAALLAAENAPWTSKPPAQWTQEEAQTTLSESPWAKSTVPDIERSNNGRQHSPGGMGGGRNGGIRMGGGLGGVGMGIPGMGGRGGGGRQTQQTNPDADSSGDSRRTPPTLTVRWESALPVQEAHLKLADAAGPAIEEDHYRIAVVNIPRRVFSGYPKDLEKKLKKQGELRREGQKTVHSTSVRVIERDNGLMILFDFPRTAEITPRDKKIEFATHLDNVKIQQPFFLDEMLFNGKLEL